MPRLCTRFRTAARRPERGLDLQPLVPGEDRRLWGCPLLFGHLLASSLTIASNNPRIGFWSK